MPAIVLAAIALTFHQQNALAQDSPGPDTTSAADSLFTLARRAQRSFEQLRIARLPTTFYRSGAGCDETIGRFCYWDEEDEDWEPGPEHEDVRAARDSLIAVLMRALAVDSTNLWATGQLTRYQLETGEPATALASLGDCGAAAWWCMSLRGLIHSRLAETEAAETAFDSALAAMPAGQRCDWRDISHLVRDDLLDLYRSMSCSRRDTLETVFWWLADPFYLQPGNDRRVEHFARRVRNALVRDAASTYGPRWRPDVEELLVRFGWPVGWERNRGTPGQLSITSHHEPTARTFVPPQAALLDDIGKLAEEMWPIEVRLGPSRHIPPYTRRMVELPHQVGIFRRGDSLLAVAAYQLPDSLSAVPLHAALVTATGGRASEHMTYRAESGVRGDFMSMSEAKSMVISLEVLARDATFGARTRYGIAPPSLNSAGVGASDIIVFEVREDRIPENLDEAQFLMLGDLNIPRNAALGLYWELYGLVSASDSVATSISIERTDRGLLRGLFEAIGLAGRRGPEVSLEWQNASGETTRVFPRAVIVDLNDIDDGNYVIRLTVGTATGESVVVERRITILD
ncbi:MAG: hypothetical protein ACE5FJ_04305 [Gemmatimonadales bacterium]